MCSSCAIHIVVISMPCTIPIGVTFLSLDSFYFGKRLLNSCVRNHSCSLKLDRKCKENVRCCCGKKKDGPRIEYYVRCNYRHSWQFWNKIRVRQCIFKHVCWLYLIPWTKRRKVIHRIREMMFLNQLVVSFTNSVIREILLTYSFTELKCTLFEYEREREKT
jgi:hypothetical protein